MMETTLGVDVIGVVSPAAVQAVAATSSGRVGLLADRRHRPAVARTPRRSSRSIRTSTSSRSPCHDLAETIQRGFPFDEELVETVRGYCQPLREAAVDTVILGSTHYPLVRPIIQRMLGRGVELITSGGPLSRQVDHVLGSRGLGNPREGEGDYRFLCTGEVPPFKELGTRFLQMPLGEVEQGRAARGGARLMARERSHGRAADELRPIDVEPGIRPQRHRVGAVLGRRDPGHLHGLDRRLGAEVAGRQGPRLAHRRSTGCSPPRRASASSATSRAGAPTGARSRSSA
jgi:hypothetical protein